MIRGFVRRHRYKLLPAALFIAAAALAFGYRAHLVAWFGGDPSDPSEAVHHPAAVAPQGRSEAAAAGAEQDTPVLPEQEYPEGVMASLRVAFDAYEEVRALLAADTVDGIAARAQRIAEALRSAHANLQGAAQTAQVLQAGAAAADELAAADDLAAARLAFGRVSRSLVALGGADDRLAARLKVFECPMEKGYNKWIQTTDRLMNPYMGPKMLACGAETPFPRDASTTGAAAPAAAAHGADEIAHYTCPMHPSVKQSQPGQCPICGMDLTPVTRHEVESGVIIIDAARRQLIGVKTAKVERRAIEKTIRTVGKITYDEERLVDVSTKVKGWIEQLHADSTGVRVQRGQTLFTVYSPELYAAQQDLLIASGRGEAPSASGFLLEAAKRRLRLWDVPAGFIDQVIARGEPIKAVPVASPASGFVIEKNVVEGSSVEPGMKLLRIANLDKVWIEAELYEAELPLVSKGQAAVVTLPYLPDKRFAGKVSFVYPYLSGETRTGRVRIELDNREIELKPDMYATVELSADRGERLVVPESAVIYAGPRRVVFLDLGQGRLRPQRVEVGVKTGEHYEVLDGLEAGDVVVTSGNFLVAAESRLKSAEGTW